MGLCSSAARLNLRMSLNKTYNGLQILPAAGFKTYQYISFRIRGTSGKLGDALKGVDLIYRRRAKVAKCD